MKMKARLRSSPIEHREALIARCAVLREEAKRHSAQVQRSLWVADLALEAGRAVKRRPLVVAAIVSALAVVRPGRAVRWLSKGLAAYSFVQHLRALVRRP